MFWTLLKSVFSTKTRARNHSRVLPGNRRGKPVDLRRRPIVEQLEDRTVPSAISGVPNSNETVDTTLTPTQLAQSLVGTGVSISNVTFTGGAGSTGSFTFADSTVIGFGQGIVLSSGSAADVVGPNLSDWTSTTFPVQPSDPWGPGDADLTALSGYPTYDAAVLEFDFTPNANQVTFQYAFASDEYPEWVNTAFNDVFAFYVNGVNYATVHTIAGDTTSPSVPVAVNNINHGNALYPDFVPARPDLFRENYFNPSGPSLLDLEQDGITTVLTFQAPVTPGVTNHMKLAIADASDGIYDSAVFIQAGSIVSNENPVADLSLSTESGPAPLPVTAYVEGEDPNGLALEYTIDWGDGTSTGLLPLDQGSGSEKSATSNHIYTVAGNYVVTLTVSNGTLSSISKEDVHVSGAYAAPVVISQPANQDVTEGDTFILSAAATGVPAPSVQWQVSTDGTNWFDIAGATEPTYSATGYLAMNGYEYQAVFTNSAGSDTTTTATLTVVPGEGGLVAPGVSLTNDTGNSATDKITSDGALTVIGQVEGALVEFSVNGGEDWSTTFSALEGENTVWVRQTEGGDVSPITIFTFTLDITPPDAPGVALMVETGSSSIDNLTKVGTLAVSKEVGGSLAYSSDGGATWSDTFSAKQGDNTVMVYQTDVAGNDSGVTTFSFTLDTTLPAAPDVALTVDSGSSPNDKLTNVGELSVSKEENASVAYSTDNGVSWSDTYSAAEGLNTVKVYQTDLAGNASAITTFAFTLDTTSPTLDPSFSGAQPFLVGATGITVSANASDTSGIASQTSGMAVDTSAAGLHTVTCTATDNAGNLASVDVQYVVEALQVNVSPVSFAYGTPLDDSQLDGTATFNGSPVTGTLTYTTAAGVVLGAGNGQTEQVTFTPADAVNFSPVQVTVTINVAQATPTFSGLSAPSITLGTALTAVSGHLNANAGAQAIPVGAMVQVTLDGVTQNAAVDGSGNFTTTFATGTLTVAGSPYTIGFSYAGDANFAAATASSTLTVAKAVAPHLTVNPLSQTVIAGNSATFVVAATGYPAPTIQWQVSSNGKTYSNIPGATSTTLTFAVSASQNGYHYRAVFTNSAGSATTKAATLTVQWAPMVTLNPLDQTVAAGKKVTFQAAADSNPTATVQWQVSTDGGTTFTNIAGATKASLTFTAKASQNGYMYRAVFTNALGATFTNDAMLSV